MAEPLTIWTDARTEFLRKHWVEGASARWIADRLGGTSKNAVIGRAHRMGFPAHPGGRGRPQRGGDVQVRKVRSDKNSTRPTRPSNRTGAIFKAPPLRAIVVKERPKEIIHREALMLSLLELTEHTCKWPLGNGTGEKQLFCGTPKDNLESYCEYHRRLSYQPDNRDRKRFDLASMRQA